MGVVTASPLVGAVLGATAGFGVLLAATGWLGLLDRPAPGGRRWRPDVDDLFLRIVLLVVGAGLIGWWTRWLVAAAAAGLLGWLAPTFVGLRARRQRQLARSEAIAVWSEMLRDLLVSNAGLAEAIGKSARVAPESIRDEVRALYVRAQRGDLSSALTRFAQDMDDAIADTVVTALQIADQRAVADLGQLLAAVATSTARDGRHAAARQRDASAHVPHGSTHRRRRGLLRRSPRADQSQLHGAVRHVHRPARPRRGVRCRGRRALGHGRALATGPVDAAVECRTGGRDPMIWAALFGAGAAAGCWLVVRALVPPARPLRTLAEELVLPRAASGGRTVPASGIRRRWLDLATRLSGGTSPRLAADLALLRRTPTRHSLDKLGYGVLCLALALVPAIAFPALDVAVPIVGLLIGAVLFAAAGWLYPDVEVRSRAMAARVGPGRRR